MNDENFGYNFNDYDLSKTDKLEKHDFQLHGIAKALHQSARGTRNSRLRFRSNPLFHVLSSSFILAQANLVQDVEVSRVISDAIKFKV